ncbi:MAG: hypothetical protein QF666_01970 [Alphaproteobacteria bacterium]|nr:hypothetical protein [Alphaproteobacteria bacterium]
MIWILALAVLVVIVVLYETNQEIRRQNDATGSQSAEAARVPTQKAQAELRSYYRSHELPTGWKVGDTELIEPDRLDVSLFFAPRIGDSRHGQTAPHGDITAATACPTDEALLRRLQHFSVWIRVNDKTGSIDSFAC